MRPTGTSVAVYEDKVAVFVLIFVYIGESGATIVNIHSADVSSG